MASEQDRKAASISPAGTAKGSNGLSLILNDHEELRDMCYQYGAAPTQSDKLKLAHEIVHLTASHAATEERYFYPFIKAKLHQYVSDQGNLLHQRIFMDDQIIKEMMHFVYKFNRPLNQQEYEVYDATVQRLCGIIIDHLTMEEQHVIAPLQSALSKQEKEQLWQDFAWGKQHAVTHAHPLAPVVGAKYTYPVVAIWDKLTDRVVEAMHGNDSSTVVNRHWPQAGADIAYERWW
eukprot:jgi/Chrzof1/536/Cz01g19120.t1